MIRRRRSCPTPRALALAAAMLLPLSTGVLPAAATTSDPVYGDVTVRVDSVDPAVPATPTATSEPEPLTFTVTLTNTSGQDVTGVTLAAQRGSPIGTQGALEDARRARSTEATKAPPQGTIDISPTTPGTPQTIAAGQSVQATFATTTSLHDHTGGLCQCNDVIYPIILSAHVTGSGGSDVELGASTTFVPSLYQPVNTKLGVSWVWPIIDQPHRLGERGPFTDDTLTNSISAGGRLKRVLQVVQAVSADPAQIPLTLVVDPDLLDELVVMAAGKYSIRPPGSPASAAVLGTGTTVAKQWLHDFTAALAADPRIDVEFTPFADPDLTSVTAAGLGWQSGMSTTMAAHVTGVLAGRTPQHDLVWPPDDAVDQPTLDAAVAAGARTVLLDSSTVTPGTDDNDLPVTSALLRSGDTQVVAALTNPTLQTLALQAVTRFGAGPAALPDLVSELAIRVITAPDNDHNAVLAAPRYVDPNVGAAAQAIKVTSTNAFATPVPLSQLSLQPPKTSSALSARAVLTNQKRSPMPDGIIDHAESIATRIPVLRDLLDVPAPAKATTETASESAQAHNLLTNLPGAQQRLVSAAWRAKGTGSTTGGGIGGPVVGEQYAGRVDSHLGALLGGVKIVNRSAGSYTLASDNARLPITVENTLPYPVRVRVEVRTQGGQAGFSAPPSPTRTIASGNRLIVQIKSQVQRSGRIPVRAELLTADGSHIGSSVNLSVKSTAFGIVGIVITVLAGAVLVLALLIRAIRQFRRRRAKARATGTNRPVAARAGSTG